MNRLRGLQRLAQSARRTRIMGQQHDLLGAIAPFVGYQLRRASGAFAGDFAAAFEGSGMRQGLIAILSIVAANPGTNQGAVGRALGIKSANMVSLIGELVDSGMIERAADPRNRRAFLLKITPRGSASLDASLARIAAHERRMMRGFSATEQATLRDLLARIEPHEGHG
ncbi:MarR family winged helix-turn-helix transcriptional regulator [Sphingomonas sp. M1-B02]|uniref:MarR family winged helix-turn-helix transcriptional regulator n=1 Tax=Sphingomonas sp. M1-B02 TaxID=3114300 RepID=UPI002240BAEA|nr:MarR family transcriptional regulator [Sphingomonas sp. S6-11]UZK67004.1 MarR family transcriptional regulator [Sphingomonas sp. S6-11]